MRKIAFIIILMFSLSSYSQNDKPKRNSYKLEIAANETQQYAVDILESPYFVKEKILQIYCGEKVFVECEIQGDSIAKMKVVEKNLNPDKTIIIDFNQDDKDRKIINTFLNVKNPFNRKLNYNAIMFTPNTQQWKRTSIIPIYPNLENYEHWPHSIITLVLENWRFE